MSQAGAGELADPAAAVRRLTFHGRGSTLFGIYIVNVLLTLVTLGVYYFWAKVRVRRYLSGQSELDGDRLAYHGTGKELLVGWCRAVLVFGVPILLLAWGPELAGTGPAIRALAGLLVWTIIMLFIPVAVVGARRYRLSRTSWRGIRFSFRGRVLEAIRLFLGGWLISLITLGLYYPFFVARRQAFLVSHSYFGNERFRFDGRGDELFRIYAGGLLLGLGVWLVALMGGLVAATGLVPGIGIFLGVAPVLGLAGSVWVWFWFRARRQRYLWSHTAFATARFSSMVTTGALLRLRLVNALLLVVTLGLAWSWVAVRNLRFVFRYVTLDGPLDVAAIQQEAQAATATGEQLAGFLDAGFDLG